MAKAQAASLFHDRPHNHATCVSAANERARAAFEEKGLKLTPLRLRVFEELAGSHTAMGAYDLLERLAKNGPRLAPISVYRALDALLAAGVVHRLESRNAFFACHASEPQHKPSMIMVCSSCGTIAEAPAKPVRDAIDRLAKALSFQLETSLLEISGVCGPCASEKRA
jgi:Fur family zinc uptake transcriptional regulator